MRMVFFLVLIRVSMLPDPIIAAQCEQGGAGAEITGLSWDCGGLITDCEESDIFAFTWADDGHQYTAWGDGYGFTGQGTQNVSSYGFTRIAGDPTSYTPTDLYEDLAGTGMGKVLGMIALGGTQYCWLYVQDGQEPLTELHKSTDDWLSHEDAGVDFPQTGATDMIPGAIIQAGQDYGDAPDSYVYSVAGDINANAATYLLRVPIASIETQGSYEVFSGTPASPDWSTDMSDRQPAFTDPPDAGNHSHERVICYFPGISRYILTRYTDDDPGDWAIYESPNPYGAWTEIASYTDFCSLTDDASRMLQIFIPPKWISPDGSEFWIAFSGNGSYDRLNLVKGTFTLE